MTLEQIRLSLADRRLEVVAEAVKLSYGTLRNIRDNPEANPTYKVMVALSAYFDARRATSK